MEESVLEGGLGSDGGQNLEERLRLGGHGVLDPLAVVVKHPADVLGPFFPSAAFELLGLLVGGKAEFELLLLADLKRLEESARVWVKRARIDVEKSLSRRTMCSRIVATASGSRD